MGIDGITKLSFFENGKKTDTMYLVMYSNGERVTYTKKPLTQNVNDYNYLHQIQQGSKKQSAVCIRNT